VTRLIGDVRTRFGSTILLLRSLKDNKVAIIEAARSSQVLAADKLIGDEWNHINDILSAAEPIFKALTFFEHRHHTFSLVLLRLHLIKNQLQRTEQDSTYLATLKEKLNAAVIARYATYSDLLLP